MKMIWARRKATPQVRIDRSIFVVWDFFRMLLATVICGLAVSFVAAAIALVLAHDAFAVPRRDPAETNALVFASGADDAEEFQPYPGMLAIGNGCGGEIVDALERDWNVTIDGKNIDVRVMQTFVVPDGEATVAMFNALVPSGSRLLRLTVHTAGSDWQGKVFDAKTYARLTAAEFRSLSRKRLLVVQNDDGAISTDAIVNIAASEAVIVEYTYRTSVDESQKTHNLMIALANGSYPLSKTTDSSAANGAVWVEWNGGKPTKLINVPSDVTLESSGTRITGLSWEARRLQDNARFQLAWSM